MAFPNVQKSKGQHNRLFDTHHSTAMKFCEIQTYVHVTSRMKFNEPELKGPQGFTVNCGRETKFESCAPLINLVRL